MTRSAVPTATPQAYGVALLAVLAATALRWLLFSELGAAAPLTIYCAAVMIAAWYGGWGPGLFATAISILIGVSFFPARAVTARLDDVIAVWIVIFVLVCVLMIALTDATRRAQRRAEEENAARRRAAAALVESEGRFRTMADTAPVKVWMSGPDGGRDWFNERWLRFRGRTLTQEAGHGWLEGLHPDDAPRWQSAWQGAVAGRGAFDLEYRLRRADGQFRWLLESGRPRVAEDGSFAGYVGSAVDVTERRQEQDRLLSLVETSHVLARAGLDLERVAGAVVEGLARSVGDACVLRLLSADNASLEPIAWAHRDAAARALLAECLRPIPHTAGLLGRAMESRQMIWRPRMSAEDAAKAAAGRTDLKPYLDKVGLSSLIIAPLLASGRVLGTLSLLRGREGPEYTAGDRDLAMALAGRAGAAVENARLMRDEQAARAEAEAANRLKDEFLATLSHELRTPLNAIVGWTELLRGGGLDAATYARALETIARNARIQTELVNDVLDVSRIISGQFRIKLAPVGLAAVLEAALETVRPGAEAKGVRIDVQAEVGVSPVAGDASRLQQAVWNILSNAVKFTPPGGRILMRLANGTGHVEICVQDTGVGIDGAFLPHVFERFRQGDSSTTRAHGGLGLGLAIVRHIVELHGGTVEAHSEGRSQGATFLVRLPVLSLPPVVDSLPEAGAQRPPGPVPAPTSNPGPRAG